MQLVANRALARSRSRIGNLLLLGSLAVFAAGAFVIPAVFRERPEDPLQTYATMVALAIGLFLWLVSRQYLQRWGPRYRQDRPLSNALEKFDNRHTLFAFSSSDLPDYLWLSPAGLTAIIAIPLAGKIRCERDRWRQVGVAGVLNTVFGIPLGNPSREADLAIERVRDYLRDQPNIPPDLEVDAIICFTSRAVDLDIQDCSHPVVRLSELRQELRRKGTLTSMQLAQVRRALAPVYGGEGGG